MNKYYLDTVALRSLIPLLLEKPKICEFSYSSLFAFIEIIKGISRKDGLRRIHIINNLLKTNLPVIEDLPMHIFLKPYGIDHPNDKKNIADILFIINKVKDAKSMEDFDAIRQEHNAIFQNLFDCYDDLKMAFSQMLSAQNCVQDKKETFTINDLSDYIFTPSQHIETTDSTRTEKNPRAYFGKYIKAGFIRNFSIAMLTIPGIINLLEANKIDTRDEQINYLITQYNGNQLDEFMMAITSYCFKKKCLREASAQSDILDIFHTIYLSKPDQILVSDDKIFEYIIPSEKLMKIQKFKELF